MEVADQLGRTLSFKKTPERIVSLVPSQTELLVYLGLEKNLVGITKFCVHPEHLRENIEVVGGTKQVHLDKITAQSPDVIICNKEENTQEMVEALQKIAPVWISDVITLKDNNEMITALGKLFSVSKKATTLVSAIKKEEAKFSEFIMEKKPQKVAYLIWKKPYMAVGNSTFINSMLTLNNFENIFKNTTSRYPEIKLQELEAADLILLSSEPFPFKNEHVEKLKNALHKEVRLVDGEYFSWYGSRLLEAFSYFKKQHA